MIVMIILKLESVDDYSQQGQTIDLLETTQSTHYSIYTFTGSYSIYSIY